MCCIPHSHCYHPPIMPMNYGFGCGLGYGFPMPMSFGCMPFVPTGSCNYMAANLGWHTGAAVGAGIGMLINKLC